MALITPHEQYLKHNGKWYDVDGWYGAQCWDGAAVLFQDLAAQYANCTKTGYVIDLWTERSTNGILRDCEPIYAMDKLHDGDIVVFQRNANVPGSHIGMFRKYENNGKSLIVFGQNQYEDYDNLEGAPFNQALYNVSDLAGAFRFKKRSTPPKPPVPPKPIKYDIGYRTHIANKGWLPQVVDGQTSGTTGLGLRMEALQINLLKGKLKVKAHIQNEGWKDYGIIDKNTVIGTTGQSKRLEALLIEPIGVKVEARVHIEDTGWTQWTVLDGKVTLGTVGMAKRMEAIEMRVVK